MGSMQKYSRFDIKELTLIGQGLEGRVYALPEDKVLKVFHSVDSYKSQLETLLRAKDSRFFPTVYDYGHNCIIMNYVHGVTLSDYLKENKIDKEISIELVKLVDEFKRLQFKRLDIRIAHIYLQPNRSIKIIDPRLSYERIQPFPRKLLLGLKERRGLKDFYDNIKAEYPNYYSYWRKKVSK